MAVGAFGAFDLDGRVADAEARPQALLDGDDRRCRRRRVSQMRACSVTIGRSWVIDQAWT